LVIFIFLTIFRIPFERGVELAKLYRVDTILQPLLDFELAPGQEIPLPRDQLSGCSTPIIKPKSRRQNVEKQEKFELPQNYITDSPEHSQLCHATPQPAYYVARISFLTRNGTWQWISYGTFC
jgi:hypothetical protein